MAKKRKNHDIKNPQKESPAGDEYLPEPEPAERKDPNQDSDKVKLPPDKPQKKPIQDPTPNKKIR